MTYKIIDSNGETINTIVADEEFVKAYTAENGWRYEAQPEPEPKPEPEPVDEVKLLKAQIKAQSERSEFMEDCIAEMAGYVYA